MAWHCSGRTNAELIDNLLRAKILATPRVVAALKQVDRARFVPPTEDPYADQPSYLGFGATISAPHMHAHALEALQEKLVPGASVMDVGCGSGYLLAVFEKLVSPNGRVLGIDHLPQLTALSASNLGSPSPDVITVLTADGRKGSPPSHTPEKGWDVIHVGAAAPTMPETLVKQLARGGRMFIPVGEQDQAVWLVDKDENGDVRKKRLFGVRYVPLTDAATQHS